MLGIAGNSEWPHIAPDAVPAPAGWAASSGSAVVEAGGAAAAAGAVPGVEAQDAAPAHGSGESWAHQDSLQAAQALLQELERSQVLQQLLQPAAGSGGALGGLDCHGWQIVLAGHGVGAGAAALLAPRLAGWHLGEQPGPHWACSAAWLGCSRAMLGNATAGTATNQCTLAAAAAAGPVVVWAFGPPGELCSPDLATAIASCCRLTAVAVGDDAAPRTTTPAVAALVDQAVVGLARLRCGAGSSAGLSHCASCGQVMHRRAGAAGLSASAPMLPQVSQDGTAGSPGWGAAAAAALAGAVGHDGQGAAPACGSAGGGAWLPGQVRGLLGVVVVLLLLRWPAQYRLLQFPCYVHAESRFPCRGCRYHAWRQQEQVQEPRCGALPGRLLVLSRLAPAQPAAAAAGDSAEQAAAGAGSSSGSSCSGTAEHAWQATWVSGEAAAAWGIRASNHALADHYVSLLLGVLGELAQPGATSSRPASSAASGGESQQPLQPPAAHRDSRGHTHSD